MSTCISKNIVNTELILTCLKITGGESEKVILSFLRNLDLLKKQKEILDRKIMLFDRIFENFSNEIEKEVLNGKRS